jgi:hypothetical protein
MLFCQGERPSLTPIQNNTKKYFSVVSEMSRPAVGPIQPTILWVLRGSFLRVKVAVV